MVAGVARRLVTARDGQDRRAVPALPLVVRPVTPARVRRVEAPKLPGDLRPELAGAQDLARLRSDEIDTLLAVNEFLRDFDPSRPAVPVRERSLEVFGDEKRIDALKGTRLFVSGVLSYGLLRCYEVHPPFVYERVSDAPVALVIENHHTYDSARRGLGRADRGIGVVGYGAGRAFCASVSYLSDLKPAVKEAFYFGDLDEAGLSIAAGASVASQRAAGPVLEPAVGLYRALLGSGHRRPSRPLDEARAGEVAAWLGDELRGPAAEVLAAGLWIPQEALGLEALLALDDWLG